jgi:hypothetical protein
MRTIASVVLLSGFLSGISAQQGPTTTPLTTVPRLVRISNTFHPANGLAAAPVEGVTFSIYKEEQGGTPLWQETQNVTVDAEGRYTALMGLTLNDGMPLELFTAGEPRWLGVQFQRSGEMEQPRVLLASVPYALKAVDAETLGGLPASSYMLSPTATVPGAPSTLAPVTTSAVAGVKSPKPLQTSGSANYIGVFTNATDLGNSVMYQSNGLIGVGTTAPLISVDARTGTFPQVGMAGTTDYLTFFASDIFGPAIYWDPAKDMRFGKGGAGLYNPYGFVEQMRIQSATGNVGIGTAAPGSRLDVSGDMNFSGNILYQGSPVLRMPFGIGGGLGNNVGLGVGALQSETIGIYNTASGLNALHANTTGNVNTASGMSALLANTTGGSNTASGAFALASNTTGSFNTASGAGALSGNTIGSQNTASGAQALQTNSASGNTAYGYQALAANTTGAFNTASGVSALSANNTASGNTANGASALQYNYSGSENTASGAAALQNNTTGGSNTAVGYQALQFSDGGGSNTAVGVLALGGTILSFSNSGSFNTASGANALQNNTTGTYNTASGANALQNNTTGSFNTASGAGALSANANGTENTAVGYQALLSNTGAGGGGNGSVNTAIGYQALTANTTGSGNTASGVQALYSNVSGGGNTASGSDALYSNVSGSSNTASGSSALAHNIDGHENAAFGLYALVSNTAGYQNTAIGSYALGANTVGNENTAVGYGALQYVNPGVKNTALGFGAGSSITGVDNIMIGNAGLSSDNFTTRIGDVQTSVYISGIWNAPTLYLDNVPVLISSNGLLGTVPSSRRYKEDIEDMGDASSDLMRLRPVTFRYKKSLADGSKPIQYGLIAEEVAEVYPDLIAHSTDGQIETVKYQLLDPMLLNELQKQNQHAQQQDDTIKQQNEQIRKLEARLAALEALLSGKASTTATAGQ